MTINEEEVRTRLHRFADQARTAPLGQPWTAAPSGPFPRQLVTRTRVAIVMAILVVAGVTAAIVAVSSNNHGSKVKTNVETNGTPTSAAQPRSGQTSTAPPRTPPSTEPPRQPTLPPGSCRCHQFRPTNYRLQPGRAANGWCGVD